MPVAAVITTGATYQGTLCQAINAPATAATTIPGTRYPLSRDDAQFWIAVAVNTATMTRRPVARTVEFSAQVMPMTVVVTAPD